MSMLITKERVPELHVQADEAGSLGIEVEVRAERSTALGTALGPNHLGAIRAGLLGTLTMDAAD